MGRHKWYNEIKAWADGAEIEWRWIGSMNSNVSNWETVSRIGTPMWDSPQMEFRIKQQPKEPKYLYVFLNTREGTMAVRSVKLNNTNEEYIGKIKLENEDAI